MSKQTERSQAIVAAIGRGLEAKGIAGVDVGPGTPVDRTLGLDSLDWAAIVVELESELGIDPFVSGVDRELNTVQDLIEIYEAA